MRFDAAAHRVSGIYHPLQGQLIRSGQRNSIGGFSLTGSSDFTWCLLFLSRNLRSRP